LSFFLVVSCVLSFLFCLFLSFFGVSFMSFHCVFFRATTCRMHDINPMTYLIDVLQRIETHPDRDIAQLTPRLWKTHFADNPLCSDLEL
jgi:hypothetical protein